VRQVIREFNADGMASLRPPTGDGRPRRIDDAAREEIRAVALARPGDLGEPGTRWSLTTLRRYLVRHKIVASISKEHLRRVLQSMGLDWGGLRRRSVPDGCDGAPVGGKHV
jgi:transposase